MSTWENRTFHCPNCIAELGSKVASSIHVTRAPAIRADILERRLHRVDCACGTRIELAHPFVYTDFDRGHWILVVPSQELASWSEWEKQLRADVRRAFDYGSPLAQVLAENLRTRVVFGLEELREKLVVWDAGLDDALLECVKVRAFSSDPSLADPRSRLLADRCERDANVHCHWFARANDPRPSRSLTFSGDWIRDSDRERNSLAARFPEFFAEGFVSVSRLFRA